MRHAHRIVATVVAATLGVGGLVLTAQTLRAAAPNARAPHLPSTIPATTPGVPGVRADGRVVAEVGAHVTLSAEIAGTIARVHAARGQRVRRGDVLLEFEDREVAAATEEARARASEAQSELGLRRGEHERARRLSAAGAVPARELEQTGHEYGAARARVLATGAAAQRADSARAKTRVVAPIDGVVIHRSIEPGETVVFGTNLMEIADPEKLRVEVELDEYYLDRVAVGTKGSVGAEAFPGVAWAGSVSELGDAVIPRLLRPLDPKRPVDVGVLPLYLTLPAGHSLRLGQRVEVTLDATARREP